MLTMTPLQQKLVRRAGIFGMICLLAASLSSCIKNNDNTVQPPFALLSVINASPGSPNVDFYLDQNRASVYPIIYGGGLDYLQAYSGDRKVSFYTTGTQTVYLADTIKLQQDKYYSLFLANEAGHQETILVNDSISRPADGKAAIRFVNLSQNAPAADLVIKDGATLVTNKGYKGVSPFVPVDQKANYTIEVRQTGTTTVLASLTNVPLNNGSIYTVWLQGVNGATDAKKLTAKIQKNVFYY
jgi:hypothetical protein